MKRRALLYIEEDRYGRIMTSGLNYIVQEFNRSLDNRMLRLPCKTNPTMKWRVNVPISLTKFQKVAKEVENNRDDVINVLKLTFKSTIQYSPEVSVFSIGLTVSACFSFWRSPMLVPVAGSELISQAKSSKARCYAVGWNREGVMIWDGWWCRDEWSDAQ